MKFPYLFMTVKAILDFFKWIVNKFLTIFYLLLPLGLFLLIMQLRDKNNKVSAIRTFTEDDGEFQFIFPDYILVANYPNALKNGWTRKVRALNKFLDKWKWLIIVGVLLGIGLVISAELFALCN